MRALRETSTNRLVAWWDPDPEADSEEWVPPAEGQEVKNFPGLTRDGVLKAANAATNGNPGEVFVDDDGTVTATPAEPPPLPGFVGKLAEIAAKRGPLAVVTYGDLAAAFEAERKRIEVRG